MKKSISTPCLTSFNSRITCPRGMKKSTSCNALTDLAVDALKYAPIHHVVQCTATSIASNDLVDFAACIASPPDLADNGHIITMHDARRSVDYNERFQALFDIIKRKRKYGTLSSNQKLITDKEDDE